MQSENRRWSLSRRDILLAGLGILAIPPGLAFAETDRFLTDAPGVLKDRLAELGRPTRREQIGPLHIPRFYNRLDALAEGQNTVDARSFGAQQDGIEDDTAALQRAVDSAAAAIRIDGGGTLRLTRPIIIDRPIAIMGDGGATVINYDGPGPGAFIVAPGSDADASIFVHDVHFDKLTIQSRRPSRTAAMVHATNVRRISVTRSQISGMGGLLVKHSLQRLVKWRGEGAPNRRDIDPAVVAGFSADSVDDLNEDVVFSDNRVDGGRYFSQALRTDFVKGVVAAYNHCRFSNISWWGGGGRARQGGAIEFQRRIQDFFAIGNEAHGCNGGIYGNNGNYVVVEDNVVEDVLDCGIDFEGCFNSIAKNNIVLDAGNFAYSTFFAAKNVRFEQNVGIQTGNGRSSPQRFAARPIGRPQGRILFALRSGGFPGDGQVDVTFAKNIFAYTGGEGIGRVLPSYSSSMSVLDNKFLNVSCDLKYVKSGNFIIDGNKFVFEQQSADPGALVGIGGSVSGAKSLVRNNTIFINTEMPSGTTGLELSQSGDNKMIVYRNRILDDKNTLEAALVIRAEDGEGKRARFTVSHNRLSNIVDRSPTLAADVRADGNMNERGGPVPINRPGNTESGK